MTDSHNPTDSRSDSFYKEYSYMFCEFQPESPDSRTCKWCGEKKGMDRHTLKEAIKTLLTQAKITKLEQFMGDILALDNYMEHDDSVVLYLKKKYSEELKALNKELPENSQ